MSTSLNCRPRRRSRTHLSVSVTRLGPCSSSRCLAAVDVIPCSMFVSRAPATSDDVIECQESSRKAEPCPVIRRSLRRFAPVRRDKGGIVNVTFDPRGRREQARR